MEARRLRDNARGGNWIYWGGNENRGEPRRARKILETWIDGTSVDCADKGLSSDGSILKLQIFIDFLLLTKETNTKLKEEEMERINKKLFYTLPTLMPCINLICQSISWECGHLCNLASSRAWIRTVNFRLPSNIHRPSLGDKKV